MADNNGAPDTPETPVKDKPVKQSFTGRKAKNTKGDK